MAPAGILEMSGAAIPSKLPVNKAGKFPIVNTVLGICNRTVAVSNGYLTRVLTVDTAVPETNPEMDSWNEVNPLELPLLEIIAGSVMLLDPIISFFSGLAVETAASLLSG